MTRGAAGMTRPAGARPAAGQAIVTVRPGRTVSVAAVLVARAGMTGRTAMAVAVLGGPRSRYVGPDREAVAVLAGRAGMTGRTAAAVAAGGPGG